jgi:tetrapyrrole methylase family protein/MazG family protein
MSITIIGLGPGSPDQLTRRAWEVLSSATEIHARTARHPTLAGLPETVRVNSFDYLYEQAESFSQVYLQIAEEVLRLGKTGVVIYAVPGHPLVGEASVSVILQRAQEQHIKTEIIAGLSFIEPALTALGLDALDGLQVFDALEIAHAHYPRIDPDRPALLAQVYNRAIASDIKLTLLNQYPPEHEVALLHAVGTEFEQVIHLPLAEIDRRDDVAHLTTLFLPAASVTSGLLSFQETIAHLRAPEGCPWDREQTHQTLRRYLLEETYEVLAALDDDDPAALREELGDLLLQIVLHAQIAIESEEFRMTDVVADIEAKIRRRHPHVFGEVKVNDADEVTRNWDLIKQSEAKTNGKATATPSALDGIPHGLPALAAAEMIGSKAARVTFDWRTIDGVFDKIAEELREVRSADSDLDRADELGDVFFALANLARWLKIDPEAALRQANAKFSARFRMLERLAREKDQILPDMSEQELDHLWNEAKRLTLADRSQGAMDKFIK